MYVLILKMHIICRLWFLLLGIDKDILNFILQIKLTDFEKKINFSLNCSLGWKKKPIMEAVFL